MNKLDQETSEAIEQMEKDRWFARSLVSGIGSIIDAARDTGFLFELAEVEMLYDLFTKGQILEETYDAAILFTREMDAPMPPREHGCYIYSQSSEEFEEKCEHLGTWWFQERYDVWLHSSQQEIHPRLILQGADHVSAYTRLDDGGAIKESTFPGADGLTADTTKYGASDVDLPEAVRIFTVAGHFDYRA